MTIKCEEDLDELCDACARVLANAEADGRLFDSPLDLCAEEIPSESLLNLRAALRMIGRMEN